MREFTKYHFRSVACAAGVAVLALACSGGRQVSVNYQFSPDERTSPQEPLTDLNQLFKERLQPRTPAPLANGKTLTLYAPLGLAVDANEIARQYDSFIALVDRVGVKPFDQDIRLLVFLFDRIPRHTRFNQPSLLNGAPVMWDRVLLERGTGGGDRTAEVLCKASEFEPHEMAHAVFSVRFARRSRFNGGGWYDEGQAEYLRILAGPAGCASGISREQARAAFADPARRRALWDFCPGCTAGEAMTARSLRARGELMRRFREKSRGYEVAAGFFFWLEEQLGRERLFELLRAVNRAHKSQDDAFYADLSARLGFDPRKLNDEEAGRGE